MRLVDLINQFKRYTSEITNTVSHPGATLSRLGRRRGDEWLKQAKIPGTPDQRQLSGAAGAAGSAPQGTQQPVPGFAPGTDSLIGSNGRGPAPRDVLGNIPRNAHRNAHRNSQGDLGTTLVLEAPPDLFVPDLPPNETLQGGWWGRYQVRHILENRGWMRLYEGLQENNQEPVWIYEYRLPEDTFNLREAETRQQAFRQVVNQNLGLGSGADFRLLKLKDLIPDVTSKRRCYLIAQPITAAQTLAHHLAHQGAMAALDVHQVLRQVLQSLHYLHQTYQVRWLENQTERGLVHGNINLDSLYIRWDPAGMGLPKPQFFVYLSRFALWEHFFWPPTEVHPLSQVAAQPGSLGTVHQDLAALGQTCFFLLWGKGTHPETEQPLDPAVETDWPPHDEAQALRPFIWRLMGLGTELRFQSAEMALGQLPPLPLQPATEPPLPDRSLEAAPEEASVSWLWLWLGGAIAAGVILGLLWWRYRSQSVVLGPSCSDPCQIAQVTAKDPSSDTTITYGFEPNSSWATAFYHFISNPADARVVLQREEEASPLHRLLDQKSPFTLQRVGKADSAEALIADVRTGLLDAVLMQAEVDDLEPGLAATEVAYDGLVPFVVFSDGNLPESIPQQLKGRIALSDLGRVFGGQPSGLGPEVRLYFPEDDATVALFKQQLENAGLLADADAQAAFDRLRREDQLRAAARSASGKPSNIYERMLVDYESEYESEENPKIGIGFDRLSRTIGQCSVYPLAVQNGAQTYGLLVQAKDRPITPATDLCGKKGGYWVNSAALNGGYPLGYPLTVVHKVCDDDEICNPGAALAALLKTDEGQYLLSEVGLTPTQSISRLRRVLWASHDRQN